MHGKLPHICLLLFLHSLLKQLMLDTVRNRLLDWKDFRSDLAGQCLCLWIGQLDLEKGHWRARTDLFGTTSSVICTQGLSLSCPLCPHVHPAPAGRVEGSIIGCCAMRVQNVPRLTFYIHFAQVQGAAQRGKAGETPGLGGRGARD